MAKIVTWTNQYGPIFNCNRGFLDRILSLTSSAPTYRPVPRYHWRQAQWRAVWAAPRCPGIRCGCRRCSRPTRARRDGTPAAGPSCPALPRTPGPALRPGPASWVWVLALRRGVGVEDMVFLCLGSLWYQKGRVELIVILIFKSRWVIDLCYKHKNDAAKLKKYIS